MNFIIGFTSGFLMFSVFLIFFIRLLLKAINKKDQIIYKMYHEGQLPIMARIEGLAIVIKFGLIENKEEIDLLIIEIRLLKENIKETLRKIS